MNPLEQYEQGCIALAKSFMHHIHDDLDNDYTIGDLNDEYFIGSESTDYASFADGSCQYVWDTPTMYLVLKNDISYETLTEHYDWSFNYENRYEKPDGWVKLEIYAWKRNKNPDMSSSDFQRMLQIEYYENRAKNLSAESIRESEKYRSDAMEKFKKDLINLWY